MRYTQPAGAPLRWLHGAVLLPKPFLLCKGKQNTGQASMGSPFDQEQMLRAAMHRDLGQQAVFYQGMGGSALPDPLRGSANGTGGSAVRGSTRLVLDAHVAGISPMTPHAQRLQTLTPGRPAQHFAHHQPMQGQQNLLAQPNILQMLQVQSMQPQLAAKQILHMQTTPNFALLAESFSRSQPAKGSNSEKQPEQVCVEEPKVDKSVPPLVSKLVPEAEMYTRLLHVEELLDRESANQAWLVDDLKRDKPCLLRTLRLSVCNTHKNQPAMRSRMAETEAPSAEGAHSEADAGMPEWTLHILGDVLDVTESSEKLSDFLDKVKSEFLLILCACTCVARCFMLFSHLLSFLPFFASAGMMVAAWRAAARGSPLRPQFNLLMGS